MRLCGLGEAQHERGSYHCWMQNHPVLTGTLRNEQVLGPYEQSSFILEAERSGKAAIFAWIRMTRVFLFDSTTIDTTLHLGNVLR